MTELSINEDIKLKQLEESDAPDIFTMIDSQREYMGKWLPFVAETKTVDDSLAYIRMIAETPESFRELVFCILYRGKFAGLIGLKFNPADKPNKRTEIGYWLSENLQKKGIMTLSAKALTDYAFNVLDLNRVAIKCATGNLNSRNVALRLGFTYEGTERDGELFPDNHFVNLEVYSMLKKDWNK